MSKQQSFNPVSKSNESVTIGNCQLSFNPFINKPLKYYIPESWKVKFEFIQHLTLFNNVLTVLLADAGNGKSTFISQLKEKCDEQITSTIVTATQGLSLSELTSKLASDFDLKSTHYNGLSSITEQINLRKKHCLLIIDDAHLLPQSIFKSLLQEVKSQGEHGYFHVLVASNYSILEYLGSNLEVDNEGLIHTIELGDFTPVEVKQYLQFMLEQAGFIGDFPLSNASFNRLFKMCEGSVGKINQQILPLLEADRSHESNDKPQVKSKRAFSKVSKFVAATLPVFVVAVIISSLIPESKTNNTASNVLALPHKKLPNDNEKVLQIKTPQPDPVLNSKIAFYADNAVRSLNKNESASQAIREDLSKKASQYTIDEFAKKSPVVLDKVIFAPKKLSEIKTPDSAKERAQKVEAKTATTKSSVKVAAKLPKDENVQKSPAKKVAAKKEKPSATELKKTYAVQILAGKNLSALKAFMQQHHLNNKSHIYHFSKSGVTWYVLTLGSYEKKDLAKDSIKALPSTLSKYKPWVRKVDDLKFHS